MYTVQSDQRDVTMMVVVFAAMTAACAMIGGLGITNYLNGNPLRASSSLLVPVYLGYWAWQVRDNLRGEPLIPILSLAWLAGLPIGLAPYWFRQLMA